MHVCVQNDASECMAVRVVHTEGEASKEIPDVPGEEPIHHATAVRHAQESQQRNPNLPTYAGVRAWTC